MIHAGRFDCASTLLRSHLATQRPSGPTAVAHLIDPSPDISQEEYWGRLDAMLRGRSATGGDAEAGSSDVDASRNAFASLLDTVSAQTRPVLLVLDDLHLVEDAVTCVDDLLAVAPDAGLRIIAVTRVEGAWPEWIDRHFDQRLIRSDSLRFEPDDVAELLRLSGADTGIRTPEIIHRVTEGLPALIWAACRTVPAAELSEPVHLEEFVAAAIDREVNRVLSRDARLSARRGALLLSAAADPLTADNAAAFAHPASGASAFLAEVDRSGMARISGPPSARERRYSHPVRSALLRLAARELPGLLDEAQRGLIALWLSLDRPHDALLAAEQIRDWPRAADIIREHVEVLYTRDYPITMAHQVLARLPEEFVASDALLRRLRSMHHRFAAPRDVPGPAPVAAAVAPPGSDEHHAKQVDALFHAIDLRVHGRFDESAALCDPFALAPPLNLDELSEEERDTEGFAFVHIGISYLLNGRFDDAVAALLRAFRTAVEPFILRDAAGKLALVNVLLGDLHEARAWLAEERRRPSLPADTEALVRSAGDVAAVLVALEDLDTDAAMTIFFDLDRPADREEFWGFILYAWGQLSLVKGTPANSLRFLEKEMLRFASLTDNGAVVGPLLDSVRAELQLACGRPDKARELVADSSHPLTAPVRARLLLLEDDPTAALALAEMAMKNHRVTPRDAIDLELIAAAATLSIGDHDQARQYLSRATSTRRVTGLRRPFTALPGAVLRRLAVLGPALPVDPDRLTSEFGRLSFVDDLSDSTSDRHHVEAQEAAQDPLTDREIHVLRALASGATNREIAAEEFVSINTVKSQLRSVYRKLAVTTRSDAVARGRLLGIL